MSTGRTMILAVAGAGALGTALYAMQDSTTARNQSPNKTRDKKNMGLEGAGIAGTGAGGGNERAIDPSRDKKVQTTAPREKLPSGGVGGGPRAGGMGARTVDVSKTGPPW
ncbi:hypothetical protein ISF_09827 [Cordyceps fumosorosea ARSEF 2679]|uniref:Uncharacterized protein n=1 Tax=Cordyceps fumosorosea (strain ARSEF 2679) TaxID=1081104 RepID=A0A167BI64_CORFA|nr:hypothetical protein ISF_09827 [Cordyceps fumosorosea ARSEF 2679]OAA40073.1 hypothetical protein ISF_09827 [Cordyceps fumosorosea ARSEF 2679]